MKEFIDKHLDTFGERVAMKQVPGRPATLKFRNKEGACAPAAAGGPSEFLTAQPAFVLGAVNLGAQLLTSAPRPVLVIVASWCFPAGGAGGEREDVRVDAWKTEHLIQFLEKKLKARSCGCARGSALSDARLSCLHVYEEINCCKQTLGTPEQT